MYSMPVVLMLILNAHQATVSCEVFVDTNSQTIEHQDCYPEVRIHHFAYFSVDISAKMTTSQPF